MAKKKYTKVKVNDILEFTKDYGNAVAGEPCIVEQTSAVSLFVKWVSESGHWIREKIPNNIVHEILKKSVKKLNIPENARPEEKTPNAGNP